MQKEEVMIELLKEISGRLSRVEEQQKFDREENIRHFEKIDSRFEKIDSRFDKMDTQRESDKKELVDKITAFEANANIHFTNISNTLAYERTRLDAVYEAREEVKVNWSNKIMAMNSAFAGIVAFIVSSFK